MEENNLKEIWEQFPGGDFDQSKLSKEMIEKYLKPKISKASLYLYFNLFFYLVLILASIVLLSMNIYGYRTNPLMLSIEAGMLLVSLAFLFYGIFVFIKLREINNFSNTLFDLLNKKIKFLNFHYEIWIVLTAILVSILVFALNTLVDNQGGTYRIYNVPLYIGIQIGMIVFIYGVNKLAAFQSIRQLKTYLADLKNSTLDQTRRSEKQKKYYVIGLVILCILLLTFFIMGILKVI